MLPWCPAIPSRHVIPSCRARHSAAQQISIEAAQPKLDLGVLVDLSSKKILLGVIDLGDPEIETAAVIADRIRNGLKHVSADRLIPAPDCGMNTCRVTLHSASSRP